MAGVVRERQQGEGGEVKANDVHAKMREMTLCDGGGRSRDINGGGRWRQSVFM